MELAGVGQNSILHHVICKLVPIYDGGHSCPPGTARSQKPFWSGTISATDTDGETFSLTSGGKYLLKLQELLSPPALQVILLMPAIQQLMEFYPINMEFMGLVMIIRLMLY